MSAPEKSEESLVAVKVEHVVKTFPNGDTPTYALREASFQALSGRLTMIVGPSGCGKTTLLSVICGTLAIDSGRIMVFGHDLQQMSDAEITSFRSRNVGFIFQQFNLVPRLSLLTNVCFGLLGRLPIVRGTLGHFNDADKRVAMQALVRVGIAEHALKRANELSGGQQQRAAIARSLVQGAELLIADEPIASLDPASARRVMDLLADMNRNDGLTVFISLHQVEYALKYCPRTIALKGGKVAYDGPSAALTPAFLNQIYGAESEELFLSPFEEPVRGAHKNGATEMPTAIAATQMAIEIERISA